VASGAAIRALDVIIAAMEQQFCQLVALCTASPAVLL